MLETLQVHNFALLEDVKVDFTKGFNVFTGETGAGKSILIDALSVVLGGRASTDFIRANTDGFWVQGVFSSDDNEELNTLLTEQGIELEDSLFLKRMVSTNGKSKATINGVQVPLQVLRQAGAILADIHGQHENQMLLQDDAARVLTDKFGEEQLTHLLNDYSKDYVNYVALVKKVKELQDANNDREHLLDLYEHIQQEIQNAELHPGEEEELKKDVILMQHGEKIAKNVNTAYNILDGESSVLSALADAKNQLAEVCDYDERLQELFNNLDSAWITIDESRSELADYAEKIDFNEERFNQIQNRLDLFYDLEKKYGNTIEDVIAYGEEINQKYLELEKISETIAKAEQELKTAEATLNVSADKLTKARKKVAAQLAQAVTAHIKDLAMPEGRVEIAFAETESFTPFGKDNMTILFSANKGEPLLELVKVASGGELSRLALAVKTVMLGKEKVPCMVFDEIDAGVGGVTAERMAEKIAMLSHVGQVLCITHLPQIVAFADRHIYIQKMVEKERTITKLDVLLEAGRVEELVRMVAGSNKSSAAIQTAEEMLKKARGFKNSIEENSGKQKVKK